MRIYSKRYEIPVVPPEREEHLKHVLKSVKRFAEEREIDIDIIRTDIDIQARLLCRYILSWMGTMKDDLQELISLCDELNIEMDEGEEYDYIIVLKFMTHAIYVGERKMVSRE